MSDRNERACTRCGSLLHHEDNCTAEPDDVIPPPKAVEEKKEPTEFTLKDSWSIYEDHIIPPAYISRQRVDIKKGFYSGAHSLLQAVELILQSCTAEEAERRIRAIKDNIEDEIRDLVQEDERVKLPVAAAEPIKYRLLTNKDTIQTGDEELLDDCKTWTNTMPTFVGTPYNSTVFVPMRRKVE